MKTTTKAAPGRGPFLNVFPAPTDVLKGEEGQGLAEDIRAALEATERKLVGRIRRCRRLLASVRGELAELRRIGEGF